MPTYETLKPKTNLPELVTFQYNEPQTGEGQYGTWYKYAIENRGVNKVLFPTKFLNDKLQAFQPLQGKTLEIVLIEIEGGKKDWRVSIPGQSGTNTPVSNQNVPQRSFDPIQNDLQVKIDELNVTISKMRVAFQSHEDRIKALETFALGANKTAFDLHSGHTEIPVIGATSGDMPKIEFPAGFLKQ